MLHSIPSATLQRPCPTVRCGDIRPDEGEYLADPAAAFSKQSKQVFKILRAPQKTLLPPTIIHAFTLGESIHTTPGSMGTSSAQRTHQAPAVSAARERARVWETAVLLLTRGAAVFQLRKPHLKSSCRPERTAPISGERILCP
jgi:hypothetical protein